MEGFLVSGIKLESSEKLRAAIGRGLKEVLSTMLGSNGLRALRYHLERKLGENMYDVFYDNPCRFYKGLKSFLGFGAEPLMRLIARGLIERGYIEGLTPREFLELLSNCDENSETVIRSSYRIPHEREW